MMHRPWDRAQPDEWLPRSLRLCWGGGDGGGWDGSGGGGGNTGGGDWGSSGAYDASGFNAGGDMSAWAGSPYDSASYSGGGGGDWGSFGATNYSGMNAPNPIFTDVAGPNPGVFTGGGDWGSAGAFSAAGTGGGPGGAMFGAAQGAAQGAGGGFWGDQDGGGLFGGGGGGGGGGYTGGGGGGKGGGGGGGAFSGGGRGSVTDSTPGYVGTASGGRDTTQAGPSYGGGIGKGGASDETGPDARGEQEGPSAPSAPDAPDAPEADPDAAPLGTPQVSETSKSDDVDPGPSLSDGAPAGNIGGSRDAAPAAAPTAAPTETTAPTSAFGPQSLNTDYQGSPYADMGPSQAYHDASQQLSNLTQTALDPYGGPLAGPDVVGDRSGVNWGATFLAPAQAPFAMQGPPAPSLNDQINQVLNDALRTGIEAPVSQAADVLSNLLSPLNPNSWVDAQSPTGMPGHQQYSGPFGGPDVVGDRGAPNSFDSRFGFETGVDPGSEQYGTEAYTPGGIEPGAEQYGVETGINPGAEQTGIEAAAPAIEAFISGNREVTDFNYGPQADVMNTPFMEAIVPTETPQTTVPSPLTPDEMARAVDVDIRPAIDPSNAGRLQDAGEPQPTEASPATPGSQPTYDTTLESGPAGAQPTTDDATTRGSDPALSGYPADPGAPVGPQAAPQTPAPPSLVEQAPSVPMPQARPADAPQPGLIDMQTLTVPMPQGRPADAPMPQGIDPGAEQTGFPANTSRAYPTLGEPGAVPGPIDVSRLTPADVAAARSYLVDITRAAGPGNTMRQQGVDVAIDRLAPEFASRLAAAIQFARANGLPNAAPYSAFRSPSMGANPGFATRSLHGRGGAVDMQNIGRPGSRESQLWYDIATRYGIINPYGPNHRAEWNHYQAVPSRTSPVPNPRPPPATPQEMQQRWGTIQQGRYGINDPAAPRPPADIPPPAPPSPGVPMPLGRPADAPQPDVPRPPADIPPAMPPATALPPAEAPLPASRGPNEFDIPVTPARAGQLDPVMLARTIAAIQKESLRGINPNTTKEQAMAQGAAGRAALIAAGVPPAMARAAMLDTGAKTAVLMGYGPGGKNATVMGFPIPQSMVQGKITEGVNEAMQGYHPAASGGVIGKTNAFGGPVQGPPSPTQQRSDVPFGQQFARELTRPPPDPNAPPPDPNAPPPAPVRGGRVMQAEAPFGGWPGVTLAAGGRDVGAPPAVTQDFPGREYSEGEIIGNPDLIVEDRGFGTSPPAPPPGLQDPNPDTPHAPTPPFAPSGPANPPGERQASLLDILQNFNPISTAEARSARGQSYPVPPGSTRSNPHFTFYGPGPGGRMEGGFETSRPNQAGTNVPITLDMVRSAREQGRDLDVTLASDPSRYGETINVGTVTYVSPIDGKQYTLDNVRGFVHDTGSAFRGRPEKVDIAVSDYTGWSERAAGDQTALAHIGAAPNAIVVAGPGEIGAPAVAAQPPQEAPLRGLAKGGRVAKNEPVVVGEEGPEYFVPDQPGTVWPHMPQPGKGGNIDRWPKIPAPEYPGQYGGVEREMLRQTRAAQDPAPGLMDMIDSGRLRLNEANWRRMIGDPDLIALGRSRIDDRR